MKVKLGISDAYGLSLIGAFAWTLAVVFVPLVTVAIANESWRSGVSFVWVAAAFAAISIPFAVSVLFLIAIFYTFFVRMLVGENEYVVAAIYMVVACASIGYVLSTFMVGSIHLVIGCAVAGTAAGIVMSFTLRRAIEFRQATSVNEDSEGKVFFVPGWVNQKRQ